VINKQVGSVAEAVADMFDGATVMIGGFGEAGSPIELSITTPAAVRSAWRR